MTTPTSAPDSTPGESAYSSEHAAPASKPWERRLTRLIVVVVLILVGVFIWIPFGKPMLGPLTMRATLATLPLFALLCIGWVPIVWAALRWMVRDTLRRFLLPIRGRHARAPHPAIAAVAFALSASAFAFVYTEFGAGYLPALQDWWEGPTHYEGLTCQNLDEKSVSRRRVFSTFELVDSNGVMWSFKIARSDLRAVSTRLGHPYTTVLTACRIPTMTLDASIYPRTGIIAEASVRQ